MHAMFPDLLGTHHSIVGWREGKVVNGLLVGEMVLMIDHWVAWIHEWLVAPHSYVLQERRTSSSKSSHTSIKALVKFNKSFTSKRPLSKRFLMKAI